LKIGFLRKLFIVELVLLFVQFVLGMFVNMYETVPFAVDFTSFAYTLQGVGFGIHHYIALFVLVFAVLALASSLRLKNSLLSKLSVLGLVLLVAAYASGTALIYLEDNDLFSLAMATSFISALIVYVSAIFLARRPQA
jgi:hypothetical protein